MARGSGSREHEDHARRKNAVPQQMSSAVNPIPLIAPPRILEKRRRANRHAHRRAASKRHRCVRCAALGARSSASCKTAPDPASRSPSSPCPATGAAFAPSCDIGLRAPMRERATAAAVPIPSVTDGTCRAPPHDERERVEESRSVLAHVARSGRIPRRDHSGRPGDSASGPSGVKRSQAVACDGVPCASGHALRIALLLRHLEHFGCRQPASRASSHRIRLAPARRLERCRSPDVAERAPAIARRSGADRSRPVADT